MDNRKSNKGHKGVAGRKPLEDKMILVGIYIRESEVNEKGGKDRVRQIMRQSIKESKKDLQNRN